MTTGRGAGRSVVSVVLVHYRTPELLPAALDAIGSQLAELGLDHELLVVDNSGDANAFDRPRTRVLQPGSNLGYAGALVAGVEASRGEVLIAMNPDVVVGAGCVAALLDCLAQEAPIAGPRFYWDEERQVLLPPGEERSLAAELLRALATRSRAATRVARRRWRRHARRHWQASAPIESTALSGALLAMRRQAWDRVGPFDAGYPLYFEETDWLARARRQGLRALHVPAAPAQHHFDQSARAEPRVEQWYAQSCRRFRERHYGRAVARLLERIEVGGDRGEEPAPWPPAMRAAAPLWVELSPRACGYPAAAQPAVADASSWRLPPDVRACHPALDLHVTLATESGRELGRYRLPAAGRADR